MYGIPYYMVYFLASQRARIGKRSPFFAFAQVEQKHTLCCGGDILVPPNFLENWAKPISAIACTTLEYFEALSCPWAYFEPFSVGQMLLIST